MPESWKTNFLLSDETAAEWEWYTPEKAEEIEKEYAGVEDPRESFEYLSEDAQKALDVPITVKLRNYLLENNIKYGLDLAGGSQLDFVIDLSQYHQRIAEEKKRAEEEGRDWDGEGISEEQVVQGVKETLRKRIDPDNSRELNIVTAEYGGEKHILIDLTADLDNEETREALSKVIDLVFKEPKTTPDDAEKEATIAAANKAASEVTPETDFETYAEELTEKGASGYRVSGNNEVQMFADQLAPTIKERIWDAEPGIIPEAIPTPGRYGFDQASGQLIETEAYSLFRVKGKEVVSRTKTEKGEDFDTVALEVSQRGIEEVPVLDAASGGDVTIEGDPEAEISAPESAEPKTEQIVKTLSIDSLSEEIKNDILTNVEPNKVSEVYEVDGGYAIYKLLNATEDDPTAKVKEIYATDRAQVEAAYERVKETETTADEEQITYDEIIFEVQPEPWQEVGLDGRHFRTAKISQDQLGTPVVSVEFNNEGAQKFEEITERLVGKPMAIFVGGELISAPTINEKISGGAAQISFGSATFYEAKKQAVELARNLNAGAIPAPITLNGELKVAAALGADALEISVKAGLIGLVLLALWMIFAYRLLGAFAVASLTTYGILILFAINIQTAHWVVAVTVAFFAATSLYVSLQSLEKESAISLLLSLLFGVITLSLFFVPIVLTLAGVAGLILSIGMAVDANILIFERMREELKAGKNYSTAVAIGFERAWTSIRDANLTTLIVCLILYFLGTEVISKFALMLGIGVILSMFTSITITKTLLKALIGSKVTKKKSLLVPLKK